MQNQSYVPQNIIARAQSRGSTCTTVRGAVRWILSHAPVSIPPSTPWTAAQFSLHESLDAGHAGDDIAMPAEEIYGYRRYAMVDYDARDAARDLVQRKYPRKNNLYSGSPRVSGDSVQEAWQTIHYRGKFSGYTGSSVSANYQSCLCISRSGRTAVQVTNSVFVRRFRAPAGMLFTSDKNGVLLRRRTDRMDYHPSYADWRAKNFATQVRLGMSKNHAARLAARRAEKLLKKDKLECARIEAIKLREIGNVRVTLEDSRRAGNCIEGSLRYAENRLGLSRETVIAGGYLFSVPAAKLMSANGDSRVHLAVESAWMRETTVCI